MKLVVFPHCEYPTQLKNDFSSFFGLFYPFDIIRDDELGILVKKNTIDDTHFFLCRQNSNDVDSLKLDGYEKVFHMDAFGGQSRTQTNNVENSVYFQNEGEMASHNIEEEFSEKFDKCIFSSKDNSKYKNLLDNHYKNRYFEPKLHFTRNFYFYGFHYNPEIYKFNISKVETFKPEFSVYSGRLDSDNKKGEWRTDMVKQLDKLHPNLIKPISKTEDFKKCNFGGINEDFKNMGWYWDFNSADCFIVFETSHIHDQFNQFFTEKTFRALMSGNMVMLGISADKHKILIDSGFWTPTNDVFDETKIRPENTGYGKELLVDTFEYLYKNGTKSVKEKNIDKIKNNQRILYDWFYKDQDFKLDAIKWMLKDDNR